MGDKTIQIIIDDTSFTMEVKGFILTPEEKDDIRIGLSCEVPFAEQLKKCTDNAKGGKYAEVMK